MDGDADDISTYRRGRVPRDVRLQQVLALADTLFAERGYSGASMDELARRAGVSKPMVYELVGSKDALFRTCMERAGEHLRARVVAGVREAHDVRGQLFAGSLAWFGFIAERRALWTALLAGGDGPVHAEADQIRRRQAGLVAVLLTEGADPDHPPSELLSGAVAAFVNGAYEALGRWWAEHPEVPVEALAELCTDTLLPGLVALGTNPPASWTAAE